MQNNHHVLVIGYVWPEPNSSAAGSRMLQLLQLFKAQDWKITFASPAAESEHAIDFDAFGIQKASITINDASFDEFITQLQPSIVMFDRFMMEEQFGWRVAEHCPDALRILDTEDLHSLRKARHQAIKDGKAFHIDMLKNYQMAKREIASILRCDLTLLISEAERDILVNDFKIDAALLHYIPFLIDPPKEEETQTLLTFETRKHCITIGNFLHAPNRDVALHIKQNVWPLLRKQLPKGTEMHVYGSYASDKVTQWNNPKEKFFVKGWAQDAKEVIQHARIMLTPLRFGAGLKGKFFDAMQCGTPSVTTTIGAEGMAGNLPWNGVVEDDINSLVSKATDLYTNESLWKTAQQNGFTILKERFHIEDFQDDFIAKINQLISNIKSHRTQNFLGSMLLLHTTKSTKYMSLWIEAKNKEK